MLFPVLSVAAALLAAAPTSSVKPAAPVVPVAEAPTPPAAPSSTSPPATSDSAPDSARRRPLRIAVYAFESAGLDERVVRITEASVLEELRKLQRVSVLSLDEVKALLDLEAEKQLAGCSESSCLAEIAEALGADALVTGGITQVGDTVSIAWKRIDPNAAAVVQTFTRQLTAAGGEELLAAVGPGVEVLFPELSVRDGLTRGVAPEVAVRLNPPPLPPAVFWVAAGTTGASAIAAVAAGVVWSSSEQALRGSFETAKTSAVPAQTIIDQQGQVQGSNAAFWALVAVAGAGAVITAFTVPFTDWAGAGSEL